MSLNETPWNDSHHRSSFLPGFGTMTACLDNFSSHIPSQPLQMPILTHEVFSEGNMGNFTQTMPIEIFFKPWVVENIHIGVTCFREEIDIYTSLFREFRDVFT